VSVKTGENIGFFNLGSSIVMVFEAPHLIFKVSFRRYLLLFVFSLNVVVQVARGEKVKLGQALTQQLTPELAREQIKKLEAKRDAVDAEVLPFSVSNVVGILMSVSLGRCVNAQRRSSRSSASSTATWNAWRR